MFVIGNIQQTFKFDPSWHALHSNPVIPDALIVNVYNIVLRFNSTTDTLSLYSGFFDTTVDNGHSA